MISVPSTRRTALAGWRLLLNGFGLRNGRKVFAVGFAKCATTSLHALFISRPPLISRDPMEKLRQYVATEDLRLLL